MHELKKYIHIAIISLLFGYHGYVMAEDACMAAWTSSKAGESCKAYSTAFTSGETLPISKDLGNGQCEVNVICWVWHGGGYPNTEKFDVSEVKRLHNCDGMLQLDRC